MIALPTSPRKLTGVLILGALVLTLTSEIIHVITFDPQNSETYRLGVSFPQHNTYMAWFSMSISGPVPRIYTGVLFTLSAVLMASAALKAEQFRQKAVQWTMVILFLCYATDKTIALHEVLPVASRRILLTYWVFWCILAIPVVIAAFKILPGRLIYWLTNGSLLLVGSLMMDRWIEQFTGRYHGHHMIGALMGDAEGLMEMTGAILMIHGLLIHHTEDALDDVSQGQRK